MNKQLEKHAKLTSLKPGKAADFAMRSRNFLGSFKAKENKQKEKPCVKMCWFYDLIYLA